MRPGRNGALVEVGNNAAFVDASVALSAQKPQLPILGKAARRRALDLRWSKVVESFERELLRLLPPVVTAV